MDASNVSELIEDDMDPENPGPDRIRAALERIVTSPQLESSPSLCRFLRYVVEETLAGRGGQIKEYSLGAEVFIRGDDFDPRIDPIVRVQARNLRARMTKYYEGPGATEPLLIDLPKRTYVPVFTSREIPVAVESASVEIAAEHQPAVEPAASAAAGALPSPADNLMATVGGSRPARRSTSRVVAAAILILLAGGALSWPMRPTKAGKTHQ